MYRNNSYMHTSTINSRDVEPNIGSSLTQYLFGYSICGCFSWNLHDLFRLDFVYLIPGIIRYHGYGLSFDGFVPSAIKLQKNCTQFTVVLDECLEKNHFNYRKSSEFMGNHRPFVYYIHSDSSSMCVVNTTKRSYHFA